MTAVVAARTGDEMSGPALLVLGLAVTGSPSVASWLLAGLTISAALGGPVLGAALDRAREPGRLLAALLAGYAAGLLAILALLGGAPDPVVIGVAVAAGLLGPALSGGWTAQLPRLVPADRLPRANVLDSIAYNLAGLAGPALAGLVAASAGANVAVIASAALVAAALPAAWSLPSRQLPIPAEPIHEPSHEAIHEATAKTSTQATPEPIHGSTTQATSETVREATAQATSETVREATAQATPETVREATAQATPEPAARATPDTTPGAAVQTTTKTATVPPPPRSQAAPATPDGGSPSQEFKTGTASSTAEAAVESNPTTRDADDSPRHGMRHELVAGFAALARAGSLRRATLTSMISYAGLATLTVTAPLLGGRLLGDPGYGALLLSVLAAGALAANAVLARFPTTRPDAVVLASVLIIGAGLALAALAGTFTMAVLAVVLVGLGEGPQLTALFAVRHREAPPRLRSQVFTTGASLKITSFALGSAMAGPLAAHSPAAALLAGATIQLVAAVAFLLSHRLPRPATAA